MRWILIALIAVWFLWRLERIVTSLKAQQGQHSRAFAKHRKGNPVVETLQRCQRCGLHVPQGEVLTADGETYCSSDCRDGEPN